MASGHSTSGSRGWSSRPFFRSGSSSSTNRSSTGTSRRARSVFSRPRRIAFSNGYAFPATSCSLCPLAALGGRRGKSKRVHEGVNAGWKRAPFHNYADYAETAPFLQGLSELLEMVSRETCGIMCAEAVWRRCHRRIVSDHVLAHGVPVVHLFTKTKGDPASLTPFAVIGARARVHYPAPALPATDARPTRGVMTPAVASRRHRRPKSER